MNPSPSTCTTSLLLFTALACGKQTPSINEDTPSSDGQPQVDSCLSLAQLYCENAPVDCEQVGALLRRAGVPEHACARTVADIEALLANIGANERHILPMVLARHLGTVMLESPTLTAEQRAQFEVLAKGPAALDVPQDFDINRLDVRCPGGSAVKGEMPPVGFERWCERADGVRHGPAHLWNEIGEWIREIEYSEGQPALVSFRLPESQQLATEHFLCPLGLIERREGSGATQRRRCETESGVASGPAVAWEGGRVVSVASYRDGEVQTSVIRSNAGQR